MHAPMAVPAGAGGERSARCGSGACEHAPYGMGLGAVWWAFEGVGPDRWVRACTHRWRYRPVPGEAEREVRERCVRARTLRRGFGGGMVGF